MKKIFTLFVLISFCISITAQVEYQITNEVSITNKDCNLSKLALILPVPQSNNYQTIENFTMSDGTIKKAGDTGNKYLHTSLTSGLPGIGNNYTLSSYFNATLYPMYIDISQFKTIYPYDTQSDIYKKYAVSKGEYIDINNSVIKQIANQLWNNANGHVIDYAYACYLYVAENFSYLNPNTGIHPIANILSQGGGDCGNLASIFINLMRVKGIPAKHIITVRPNGTYHVWADFYLQNYGWVPVDVNMKLDYPNGDYFGYCAGDGIVMSEDICNQVEYDAGKSHNAVILQNYYWWYWHVSGSTVLSSHRITNQIIDSAMNPKLHSFDSNSATVKCTPSNGVSGYKVKLYKKDNKQQLEKEYHFDGKQENLLLDDLTSATSYIAEVYACRKVEAIETTMGQTNISFTTDAAQVKPELSLSNLQLEFNKDADSKTIEVTSNISWTANTIDSWLTISPAYGSTDATVTITTTTNLSTTSRTGSITFKGGDIIHTVMVTQEAASNNTNPTEVLPTTIILDNNNILLAIGEQKQLTATILPSDATDKNVKWLSANTDIAAVDENGLVSAVSEGSTTITVESLKNGIKAECVVDVTIDSNVGNVSIENDIYIYYQNGSVYINSVFIEQIDIFSVSGSLLYQANKSAGETTYRINHLPNGVLFVRGSSGWMKKLIK